ncbi:DUF402 domain-containing protein [Pradoshia sp. D12]|uniref:DUF402 domain-containing protein n=1 Tax=Bacillaceae TaxID=186817 RepID=UPI00112B9AB3|nr:MULTISPECIES: DUF402 domain-containing protein [Bacillaceae]QFK70115.1 DUF402 domain-containing protein [Pradoshia sp. D12]TPF70894.1 DUF402 domain-containing protein [Bacillus sp. D12]
MLKRKYANCSKWKRVLDKKYAQVFLDTKEFKGYISLLQIIKVAEPLFFRYKAQNICIVDDGYMWLQQFPLEKKHSVTTMFDNNGNIVQWYIDVCLENGVDNDIPYLDDLYLDIILLPSGEVIQKDADELEEAFFNGIIDKPLYDIAWDEAQTLTELIKNKSFELIDLSHHHKEFLANELKKPD